MNHRETFQAKGTNKVRNAGTSSGPGDEGEAAGWGGYLSEFEPQVTLIQALFSPLKAG